ncbi:MYXO-CTERM sorting domain-containing protein [Streptomyces ardesiacus]
MSCAAGSPGAAGCSSAPPAGPAEAWAAAAAAWSGPARRATGRR